MKNDRRILFKSHLFPLLLTSLISLAGCTKKPIPLNYEQHLQPGSIHPSPNFKYQVATAKKPAIHEKIITKYVPLPLPGQKIPIETETEKDNKHNAGISETTIKKTINETQKKSIQFPRKSRFINAIMKYDYVEGALYEVYSSPLKITDIQMKPGEHVVSVSAGDTARWQVSNTTSGTGDDKRQHLLLKPIESDIENNLVITTDQRTYHLVLHATKKTYMTAVSWNYPNEDSMVMQFKHGLHSDDDADSDQEKNKLPPINMNHLDFKYRMFLNKTKIRPKWTPIAIFNDGTKTYIRFPKNLTKTPLLFIATREDKKRRSQPTNYRVHGDYYIVDSILDLAQLRMGQLDPATIDIMHVEH